MRIAKRGGGYREVMDDSVIHGEVNSGVNLVSLSGATGGVELLTTDEAEANKVHLRILDLKRRYQDTQFQLAALLWRVNDERLFKAKSLGAYETFRAYVESELEFSVRKAQMLITMHWWYGIEQKGDPELLEGAREIGWTKAHRLVNVVDTDNADQWFTVAKRSSEKSLGQQVKAALQAAGKKRDRRVKASKPTMNPPKGMTPDDPEPETPTREEADEKGLEVDDTPTKPELPAGVPLPPTELLNEVRAMDEEWITWSTRIPKSTKTSIDEAIGLAKKLGDTHNTGYALGLIAQHFLSFSHDKATVMVGEWLAAFERNTGLKVVAVDPKDEKVVYGQELLGDDTKEA